VDTPASISRYGSIIASSNCISRPMLVRSMKESAVSASVVQCEFDAKNAMEPALMSFTLLITCISRSSSLRPCSQSPQTYTGVESGALSRHCCSTNLSCDNSDWTDWYISLRNFINGTVSCATGLSTNSSYTADTDDNGMTIALIGSTSSLDRMFCALCVRDSYTLGSPAPSPNESAVSEVMRLSTSSPWRLGRILQSSELEMLFKISLFS